MLLDGFSSRSIIQLGSFLRAFLIKHKRPTRRLSIPNWWLPVIFHRDFDNGGKIFWQLQFDVDYLSIKILWNWAIFANLACWNYSRKVCNSVFIFVIAFFISFKSVWFLQDFLKSIHWWFAGNNFLQIIPSASLTHLVSYNRQCSFVSVVRSCNFRTWPLRHIRRSLTRDVVYAIGCSVVNTRLDYWNSLLFGVADTHLNKLHRVQN